MSQSHGLTLWRESVGSGAVPRVTAISLVATGVPGEYALSTIGTPAGALVSTGTPGSYAFDDSTTTGDLRMIAIGNAGVFSS
jgi:hypothetical protein